jgi:hypothetical protein
MQARGLPAEELSTRGVPTHVLFQHKSASRSFTQQHILQLQLKVSVFLVCEGDRETRRSGLSSRSHGAHGDRDGGRRRARPRLRAAVAGPARRRLLPPPLRLPRPPTTPPREAGQGAVEAPSHGVTALCMV